MTSPTCHHKIEFFHDCGHQIDFTIHIPSCPRSKKINRRPKANKPVMECLGSLAKRCYTSGSCTNCNAVEEAGIAFGNNIEFGDAPRDQFPPLVVERRRVAFQLSLKLQPVVIEVSNQAPVAQRREVSPQVSPPKAPCEAAPEDHSNTSSDKSYQVALSDAPPRPPKQPGQGKKVLKFKRNFGNPQTTEGKTNGTSTKAFKKTTVSLPSAAKLSSQRSQGYHNFDGDDDDGPIEEDDGVGIEVEHVFSHKHLGAPMTANPRRKGARERLG